jgi:hypothetical protein
MIWEFAYFGVDGGEKEERGDIGGTGEGGRRTEDGGPDEYDGDAKRVDAWLWFRSDLGGEVLHGWCFFQGRSSRG